jgi:hypothetical protein
MFLLPAAHVGSWLCACASSAPNRPKFPRLRRALRVTPNPSLNHRTRYGGPSWPGLGYAVHSPNPSQAVLPQRSG